MTDIGEASNYLGVEIHRQDNGIFVNQRGYIMQLLERFGLQHCNPTQLPSDPKVPLQKHMGTKVTDQTTYCSLVGSLLYLTNTRPNICHAVSCVSKYMEAPEEAHFQVAKKILRYLKRTADHAILMTSDGDLLYQTFVDAD